MSTLDSIVLPLAESRKLVEKGIVLDTAMMWVVKADRYDQLATTVIPSEDTTEEINGLEVICGAPTLSELLDAIRAKVGNPLEERTIILSQDGHLEVSCCAGVRSPHGEYQIAYNDTDLLAAYALLMEVSK